MSVGVLVGGKRREEVLEEHLAKVHARSGLPPLSPTSGSSNNLCKLWNMYTFEGPGHFYLEDKQNCLLINAVPFMGKLLQVEITYRPFIEGADPDSVETQHRHAWELHNDNVVDPNHNAYGGFLVASAPFYITIFRTLQEYCQPFKDGENPMIDKAKDLVKTAFDTHICTLTSIMAKRDDLRGLVIHDSNMPYESSHGIEEVLHGNGRLGDKDGAEGYCQKVLGCSLAAFNNLARWFMPFDARIREDNYREIGSGLLDQSRVVTFCATTGGNGIRLSHPDYEMPAMGVRAREIITNGGSVP